MLVEERSWMRMGMVLVFISCCWFLFIKFVSCDLLSIEVVIINILECVILSKVLVVFFCIFIFFDLVRCVNGLRVLDCVILVLLFLWVVKLVIYLMVLYWILMFGDIICWIRGWRLLSWIIRILLFVVCLC